MTNANANVCNARLRPEILSFFLPFPAPHLPSTPM